MPEASIETEERANRGHLKSRSAQANGKTVTEKPSQVPKRPGKRQNGNREAASTPEAPRQTAKR